MGYWFVTRQDFRVPVLSWFSLWRLSHQSRDNCARRASTSRDRYELEICLRERFQLEWRQSVSTRRQFLRCLWSAATHLCNIHVVHQYNHNVVTKTVANFSRTLQLCRILWSASVKRVYCDKTAENKIARFSRFCVLRLTTRFEVITQTEFSA